MSAPKHTPGPWGVSDNVRPSILAPALPRLIATVSEPGDFAQADARLIAAAPDMAEAGQNALALLRSLGKGDTYEAMALANALSKARGA